MTAVSRRRFVQSGAALACAGVALPAFIGTAADACAALCNRTQRRVLVIATLSGGNDGLNTVVPFRADWYHAGRPTIGIGAPGAPRNGLEALRLSDTAEVGLHPSLGALRELYDEGAVGIIQGVGYPDVHRSHFASMDVWETACLSGEGPSWVHALEGTTDCAEDRNGFLPRVQRLRFRGFDTHASQAGQHALSLEEWSRAMLRFQRQLEARGAQDRVLILCHSEFGRSVRQNRLDGTSHGTSGPVFVIGARARAGVLNGHPVPSGPEGRALGLCVDFRSIYRDIAERWLGTGVQPAPLAEIAPFRCVRA